MPMLQTIVRKELREVGRDAWAVGVMVAFVVILALICLASRWTWARQAAIQVARQRLAREVWLTQANDSPHQATHDGTTVYKLPSPLAAVDPGVDPELGTAIRLESHRRHESTNSPRRDRVKLLPLDLTNPAVTVQALLPLVVILVGHAIVAREREQGTWSLLCSLGVSRRQVVIGKLIAMLLLTIVLSAPVLITLSWTVLPAAPQTGVTTPGIFHRAFTLYAVNLLYLVGWCAAGLTLSSRCSSAVSLVLLISCWAGFTLIIPRLAVDLAYSRFPLPSQLSMRESRDAAIRHGSDGNDSLDEFNAAWEQKLLKEYGVSRVQDMPVHLNAVRLLAMEEFTDSIDDRANSQLTDIHRKQNRFLDWFGAFSPYLTVRSVSESFAGTDRHHHAAFVASAEQYRRSLVKIMNTAEVKGSRPGSTAEKARRFWNQVPEFQQRLPSPLSTTDTIGWSIGVLLVWCLSMPVIAVLSATGSHA